MRFGLHLRVSISALALSTLSVSPSVLRAERRPAASDAPPPIFTAIQEQIGLKLDAEKTAVDVMILDHAEKPSDN